MAGKPIIYLDYAAATPMDPAVLASMQPYFSSRFYNPSATYTSALDVKKDLERARSRIAHWLGARPGEIIFTAGGTEANNLAIQGVMKQYPKANIVVSSIEHESILAPAHDYDCREAAVKKDGRLDLADLEKQIDKNTVLVSVMYANNEAGTIQAIREAAKIIDKKRREKGRQLPLYFHTDACQAANYLDLHASRLGADMMTLNGGKIYGPKQSGVLYVKAGIKIRPLISGGGQERGYRSGTENVTAAIGLAEALEIAQSSRQEVTARLKALQAEFIELAEKTLPGSVLNGSTKYRLPNNVHLTFPGKDNERLLIQLEMAGILAAAGSACSASSEEPSHVLRAMGLGDSAARSSIRFTLGRQTSSADIKSVIKTLQKLL